MSLFWKEQPEYLDKALESLIKQTTPPTEILLVVEGVLPDSLNFTVKKWIDIFTPSILKLIPADKAKGLPACLNVGLNVAKGDIIIRFDTDDWCFPNRIEEQLNVFKSNSEISLTSAVMEEYDEKLEKLLAIRKVPLKHDEIYKYAKLRNPFNHPSVAYKRDVAITLGGYPLVNANEDYAFFCNFLINGYKATNISYPIVKARTGKQLAIRRSGKNYRLGEVECLEYLRRIGFYTSTNFYFHLLTKKIIRSLPTNVVGMIYKYILRK